MDRKEFFYQCFVYENLKVMIKLFQEKYSNMAIKEQSFFKVLSSK